MRIDVVTLFPEMVEHAARLRRDRPGARARAVAAGDVESARLRDGQLPHRRRPSVRRRTGDGDAGGTAGAGAGGGARRRSGARGREAADDPPDARRRAAQASLG